MTEIGWDEEIELAEETLENTENPTTSLAVAETAAPPSTEVLKVADFLKLQKDKARKNISLSEGQDEETVVLQNVIIDLDRFKNGVDKTIMAALWEIHRDALYVNINGAKSLEEAVEEMRPSLRNYDYTLRVARGVQTILEYIHQRQESEDPIVADDGTKVTVETFIEEDGFVSKISQFWADFEKSDNKEVLAIKLATESRSKISAYLKQGNEQETTIPKIKYKVEEKAGNKKRIVMDDLTEEQYKLFMKFAEKILDVDF